MPDINVVNFASVPDLSDPIDIDIERTVDAELLQASVGGTGIFGASGPASGIVTSSRRVQIFIRENRTTLRNRGNPAENGESLRRNWLIRERRRRETVHTKAIEITGVVSRR